MTPTPTRAARPMTPAPAPPATPRADDSALRQNPTPRLVEWLESVSNADSAMVMRVEIVTRVESHESKFGTRVASSNSVGRPWIARFSKFVRTQLSMDPKRECGSTPASISKRDQLILRVRFGPQDQSPTAVVRFQDRCVELQQGGVDLSRVELDPMYGYVLGLAREALPNDEMVRRLSDESLPSKRTPDSPGPRAWGAPPGAPSGGPDHPQPGEYVFTEELPEAITKVPPSYPDEARRANIDGTVVVMVLVGHDGSVKDVRMQKSIPALDAAAMACVRQWKFKPATAKGEPVAVWVIIPVRFTLH
jgi:periplasmic protein TonB